MAGNHSLVELASKVTEMATAVTSHMNSVNAPLPSLDKDGLHPYPPSPEVQGPRMMLIESLMDMLHVAIGPVEFQFWHSLTLKHDMMVIGVLSEFDFYSAVPVDGSATYVQISEATGLPTDVVRRILRHAFTMRLFAESSPGSDDIIHTASSAVVVKTPELASWIIHNTEEVGAGCVQLPEALRRYTAGKDQMTDKPGQAASSLALYNPDSKPELAEKSFFQFVAEDGEGERKGWREERFGQAMQSAAVNTAIDPPGLLKLVDWASFGNATLVDVGGSTGHISQAIANIAPNVTCVVEDLPGLEAKFDASLTNVDSSVSSRISFRAHDFFTPQPVQAEIYFLKHILHDWADSYARKIIGQITPQMKPGSRFLIFDGVMPPMADEKGNKLLPLPAERFLSALDLQMMVVLNAKERTVEEWKELFQSVDAKIHLDKVHLLPGTPFGILEFVYTG
ncbi:S-adenosyl-L-methionine-dependent methyltransferase [Eremomyces bilateralis CBS 781.70]|uniref:S-adenosyl-L-methionine-dependent methyltransferase n=1 Tax=Eremomyces bilateralis CBS 781.70 TaxID=1392243 RepID=A0A6G1FR66_9PEZI|nr:S-adenosyl-L-methionine-dependent methyltransferase [Eremomyces bilateralis CBS 781.70]KAF1808284.1 S-adenosyl-L-methionine-dependent methyltransferase [Eremomyces bilateralis CBS 781.70]